MGRLGTGQSGTGRSRQKLQLTLLLLTGLVVPLLDRTSSQQSVYVDKTDILKREMNGSNGCPPLGDSFKVRVRKTIRYGTHFS
jgi:hypothetical protein